MGVFMPVCGYATPQPLPCMAMHQYTQLHACVHRAVRLVPCPRALQMHARVGW